MSFQAGGTKLEIFLPENQHTQNILLNFENWCSARGEVLVKECQNLVHVVVECPPTLNVSLIWRCFQIFSQKNVGRKTITFLQR